jgi:hypothetical protein
VLVSFRSASSLRTMAVELRRPEAREEAAAQSTPRAAAEAWCPGRRTAPGARRPRRSRTVSTRAAQAELDADGEERSITPKSTSKVTTARSCTGRARWDR